MQAADRRDEILDAAQAILGRRGVRAATIEEITSRAGIAKGTFYLYFDSKDAVQQALRERLGAALLRDVEAALKRKNRNQAIGDFIAAVIDFNVRNDGRSGLAARRPEGFPPADSERAVGTAFARFLADGVRAGDFDIKDPQALASLLYGSLRAAFEDPGASAESASLRDAAEEMFRLVLVRKRRKK